MQNVFSDPDFTLPLDVDAAIAACPPDATLRGMYYLDIVSLLKAHSHPVPTHRYQPFGLYPLREFMQFAAHAATRVHPGVPVREGLRRFGQLTFTTFRETMLGRVIFGSLGNNLGHIIRLAASGYEASLKPGTAQVLELHEGSAIVRLVDVYNFPDCYQVGVFEGAVTACRFTGKVKMRAVSPSVSEFALTWS